GGWVAREVGLGGGGRRGGAQRGGAAQVLGGIGERRRGRDVVDRDVAHGRGRGVARQVGDDDLDRRGAVGAAGGVPAERERRGGVRPDGRAADGELDRRDPRGCIGC